MPDYNELLAQHRGQNPPRKRQTGGVTWRYIYTGVAQGGFWVAEHEGVIGTVTESRQTYRAIVGGVMLGKPTRFRSEQRALEACAKAMKARADA